LSPKRFCFLQHLHIFSSRTVNSILPSHPGSLFLLYSDLAGESAYFHSAQPRSRIKFLCPSIGAMAPSRTRRFLRFADNLEGEEGKRSEVHGGMCSAGPRRQFRHQRVNRKAGFRTDQCIISSWTEMKEPREIRAAIRLGVHRSTTRTIARNKHMSKSERGVEPVSMIHRGEESALAAMPEDWPTLTRGQVRAERMRGGRSPVEHLVTRGTLLGTYPFKLRSSPTNPPCMPL
jgi:hypothetical protein